MPGEPVDPGALVRHIQATWSACTPDDVARWALHENPGVRKVAIDHPACPLTLVFGAVEDGDIHVQQAAIRAAKVRWHDLEAIPLPELAAVLAVAVWVTPRLSVRNFHSAAELQQAAQRLAPRDQAGPLVALHVLQRDRSHWTVATTRDELEMIAALPGSATELAGAAAVGAAITRHLADPRCGPVERERLTALFSILPTTWAPDRPLEPPPDLRRPVRPAGPTRQA